MQEKGILDTIVHPVGGHYSTLCLRWERFLGFPSLFFLDLIPSLESGAEKSQTDPCISVLIIDSWTLTFQTRTFQDILAAWEGIEKAPVSQLRQLLQFGDASLENWMLAIRPKGSCRLLLIQKTRGESRRPWLLRILGRNIFGDLGRLRISALFFIDTHPIVQKACVVWSNLNILLSAIHLSSIPTVTYCNAWSITPNPWGYTTNFGRRWGYYTQRDYTRSIFIMGVIHKTLPLCYNEGKNRKFPKIGILNLRPKTGGYTPDITVLHRARTRVSHTFLE